MVTPGAFGRFEEVQWRPLSGNPRLNEALPTEREEREAVLAAASDSTPSARLLRGDGPMEVEDFATMQRLLGVRPFGVPSDVPRLAGTETEPE